jgi:hypothetical protein
MKHKKTILLTIVAVCLAILIIIAAISYPALNQDSQTRSFYIPFNVDFQHYVKSSILIKADVKMYGDDYCFEEFTLRNHKPYESKMKELILVLHQQDLEKCRAMSKYHYDASEEEKNLTNFMSAGLSKMFRDEIIGSNLEHLYVTERFNIGKDALFIWGLNSSSKLKDGIYRNAFRFIKNDSGSILWSPDLPDALTSILKEISRLKAESPEVYAPVEHVTLKYESPLVENTKKHQVYFCCDGIPCDVNVYSDNSISSNEIISFYKEAYHTLRNKGVIEFSKFYTEASGKKFLESYSKTDDDYIKYALGELINNERKIIFVLNGDPVYIIFYYNPKFKNTSDILKRIKYEYVVRENGALKLSNLGYEDYLDDLLKNHKNFIEPVLGPIIKNIGL